MSLSQGVLLRARAVGQVKVKEVHAGIFGIQSDGAFAVRGFLVCDGGQFLAVSRHRHGAVFLGDGHSVVFADREGGTIAAG